MRICFIQHEPYVGPGYYLTWARDHQYDVQIINCHVEKPTPQLVQKADMLVVLGGPQNPHTSKQKCSYFDAQAERETIRAFIQQRRMVVGVCLGGQLIGESLGIPYEHSLHKEEGAVQVWLNESGKQDPLLQNFQDSAFLGEWHNDMMGVNSQTPVLAFSEGCPRQIVRYGELVYGLQCHMELTPPDYERLIDKIGDDVKKYQQYQYVQSAKEIRKIDCQTMNRNLVNFLDNLINRYQELNDTQID
ncbi:GMP synthase [Limosilactobacillus sp. Sa3CUN2]|uniref:GMP synthase n=1 Tax=Limosilactobacillus avistercoris TaxID=2762243 RepID=A0ABR8PAR5_9LACO|nr:GMP synthase [Limosilactobacillus avistercoris]MBD7894389.1 GMP synthase [Limosilactobacillus avistercoris]